MLARVRRIKTASEAQACTTIGMIRWAGVPLPLDGRIRQVAANSQIIIRPIQYTGAACPKTANALKTLSYQELGRTAASTPNGTPIRTASSVEVTASSNVAGARDSTSDMAGVPNCNDLPKSPR